MRTAKLLHSVTVCSPQFLVVYEGCSKSQYSWNFYQRLSWALSEVGTIVLGTICELDSTHTQICALHLPFFVIKSISINNWRHHYWESHFCETTLASQLTVKECVPFVKITFCVQVRSNGNNNLKQHIKFKAISIAIMGFLNVTIM
jgi:hypothetical protein